MSENLAVEPSDEVLESEQSVLEIALQEEAAAKIPLVVKDIPLDQIAELDNIRPVLHGIDELAATIHVEGQLQPCVVREAQYQDEHGKQYELVFGYRRKAAVEKLGHETLRCEVRNIADSEKISQMIVENFQREDLSPVARARAIYALKYSTDPPLSNREVGKRLGVHESQISHQLTMLLKLAPPEPEPEQFDEQEDVDPGEEAISVSPAVTTVADIPGGQNEASESHEEKAVEESPKQMDILALVDDGTISASTAEVIASLDDQEDREQLANLVVRNDWGVKKASTWARDIKANKMSRLSEEDKKTTGVMMLDMAHVTPLQRFRLGRLTNSDYARLTLYMQLRNGMDYEVLDYIQDQFGFPYENIWGYISELSDDEVKNLSRMLTERFVTAAHRITTIEQDLRDRYETDDIDDRDLALPEA